MDRIQVGESNRGWARLVYLYQSTECRRLARYVKDSKDPAPYRNWLILSVAGIIAILSLVVYIHGLVTNGPLLGPSVVLLGCLAISVLPILQLRRRSAP